MKYDLIEDYVYTRQLDLNLVDIKKSCYLLEDLILKNFNKDDSSYYSPQATMTTNVYSRYNVFLYPYSGFGELYSELKDTFRNFEPNDYWCIQCWLNIYKHNEYIDWHSHWHRKYQSWHGYFCVDCEPSKTTYKIPVYNTVLGKNVPVKNEYKQIDVISKNNKLVMSKSDGDKHRTWPWEHSDRDRITIAFDIIKRDDLNKNVLLNHWVPI